MEFLIQAPAKLYCTPRRPCRTLFFWYGIHLERRKVDFGSIWGPSRAHLGVILGSFWVLFWFWPIFHFLKGPVKNHVGPFGFLMIYARTEEVPFWSLFLETSTPGGQKAPGTLKNRLFLHLRVAMVDMLIPWGKPTFALSGTGFWECPNHYKNGVWAWGG